MDVEKIKHDLLEYSRSIDLSSSKGTIEFGLLQVYYNKISEIESIDELDSLLDEIKTEHKYNLKNYDELYIKYQELLENKANKATLESIVNKLNYFSYSASALVHIALIVSKYVGRKINITGSKKETVEKKSVENKNNGNKANLNKFISTPVKEQKRVTSTPQPKATTTGVSNYMNIINNNEITRRFLNYSREIIRTYKKLRDTKTNDRSLIAEISKNIIERRKFIQNLYSNNDEYSVSYAKLMNIEKIENDIYSDVDEHEYPFNINGKIDFYKKLEDSFKSISKLNFSQNKDSFKIISANKYHNNLLASLFGTNDISNEDYRKALELSNDIIHLMSAYNIYADEKDFVNINSKNNIATQKVTKESIRNAKETIDSKKKKLYEIINARFKSGNQVITVTNYDKSIKEKENALFVEYFKYCAELLKVDKNKAL